MSNILDKNFKYTNAASTDIRKTFARVKRELEKKKAEPLPPVPTIIRVVKR